MSVKVGEFEDGSPINTIMVSELIAKLQTFPQHLPVIARIITPNSDENEEVETLVAPFIGIDTDTIENWIEGQPEVPVVSLAVPIPGNIVEIDDEDDELEDDEDLEEVDEDESDDETDDETDLTEDEDDADNEDD